MAEALAKRAAEGLGLPGLEIASAGTAAQEGQPASSGARHAMAARGLSLEEHRARRLTPELAASADIILTMSASHAEAVKHIAPEAKTFTLYEFVGEVGDVADPWGGSDASYETCAQRLEPRILRVIQRLRREGEGS